MMKHILIWNCYWTPFAIFLPLVMYQELSLLHFINTIFYIVGCLFILSLLSLLFKRVFLMLPLLAFENYSNQCAKWMKKMKFENFQRLFPCPISTSSLLVLILCMIIASISLLLLSVTIVFLRKKLDSLSIYLYNNEVDVELIIIGLFRGVTNT